jgi:hypothetical protein
MSKLFPKSANRLPLQIVIYLGVLGGIASAGINYYATNKYANVGYAPLQPVPYSHLQPRASCRAVRHRLPLLPQ